MICYQLTKELSERDIQNETTCNNYMYVTKGWLICLSTWIYIIYRSNILLLIYVYKYIICKHDLHINAGLRQWKCRTAIYIQIQTSVLCGTMEYTGSALSLTSVGENTNNLLAKSTVKEHKILVRMNVKHWKDSSRA